VLFAGLAVCAGVWAQSTYAPDPTAPVALQTLLNQGFEVKAASTSAQGVQMLYLQKAAILYACPINVAGLACSRIVSM
jgi:hypothetical protein